MSRRIAVLLSLFLAIAVFTFAEEEQKDTRPLVAVPDFLLQPAGQFEDEEMGVLAASMIIPYLEQRYRVLDRDELLKFLEANKNTQLDLFTSSAAASSLKNIGVTILLMGRINKIEATKFRIEMLMLNLENGKIEGNAKPGQISKTGDLANECRRMAQELVEEKPEEKPPVNEEPKPTPKEQFDPSKFSKVQVEIVTSEGSFKMRFFPNDAPITVQNFIRLAYSGHFKDKYVHRVIKDFIVQMGAADKIGTAQTVNIPNEFNNRPHVRGAVAMARNVRAKGYSHGTQFYVALKTIEKLDRNFTVFAHVVEGMDVIDKISMIPVINVQGNPFFPEKDVSIEDIIVSETDAPFNPPPPLPPMITTNTKGVIIAEVSTSMGTFFMRFHPDKAPRLVENFLDLAQRRFYDGLEWHRVIRDFVIQSGDPDPDDPQFEEAPRDVVRESPSDLKNLRGTVAGAKSQEDTDINSTSQFYINVKHNEYLDGKYAVFATVYKGLEVVDTISKAATDGNDRPIEPVYINKIVIKNLGDVVPPWDGDGTERNLVPAPPNTPHSKMIAVISTDAGDIHVKFFADQAPKTVANFISLAQKGFYDGMFIHRVSRGKIVQFGDHSTNNQTEPPTIPDEKSSLRHYKGTIAMAHVGKPNSATCQFFINVVDNPEFDGSYFIFAEVIKGMDVVEQLSNLKTTDYEGRPESRVFFSVKLMKYAE